MSDTVIKNFIKLEVEVGSHSYRLNYRCNNCGMIFEYDMAIGQPTSTMTGSCPHCQIKSRTIIGGGVFVAIKLNSHLDEIQNPHYR